MRDSSLSGEVRLGIAEDIAVSRLPRILQSYRRAHANVILHVEIDMSLNLLERLDKRDFDLVLCKRLNQRQHSAVRTIHAEPLVWVGVAGAQGIARMRPLPLALHSDPSVTRQLVLDRLKQAGIPYRVSHTSWSISGIQAGVAAGLGITACGRGFVPHTLCALDAAEYGLPQLPSLDFVLSAPPGRTEPCRQRAARGPGRAQPDGLGVSPSVDGAHGAGELSGRVIGCYAGTKALLILV